MYAKSFEIQAANNLDTADNYMAVGSILPVTKEKVKYLKAAAQINKQHDMKEELTSCYALIGEKYKG